MFLTSSFSFNVLAGMCLAIVTRPDYLFILNFDFVELSAVNEYHIFFYLISLVCN